MVKKRAAADKNIIKQHFNTSNKAILLNAYESLNKNLVNKSASLNILINDLIKKTNLTKNQIMNWYWRNKKKHHQHHHSY